MTLPNGVKRHPCPCLFIIHPSILLFPFTFLGPPILLPSRNSRHPHQHIPPASSKQSHLLQVAPKDKIALVSHPIVEFEATIETFPSNQHRPTPTITQQDRCHAASTSSPPPYLCCGASRSRSSHLRHQDPLSTTHHLPCRDSAPVLLVLGFY